MGQALEGKVRIPGLRTPGTRRRAAAAALLGIGILVLGAALQEPLGDWWRKSTVNASLVDQVAEARQAADAARGNLLEFGEFASLAVFEQAVVGMDRGDEARARWRLAEALEEYEKARALLVRQIAEADQKRSDHEVYEGARVALASAENDRLFAQRALEDVVAKAEREAARFPQEPTPGADGEERLRHRDSRDGTQGAVALARGAYARWCAKCLPEERGADPKERASLLRSREAADRALLLRGRGRFREAADEYGTALLHYWKALAEGQRTALEALLGPVPGGAIAGLDGARGTMDRAVQMELVGQRPAEVAEGYREAERAFRDLLPPALEAATVALVADFAEHRCADCGGNGTCPACSGTKRGKGPCSHCMGTGSVDVTCPACKGGKEEPCTACHERGSRIGDCPECRARGRKPCPTCAGKALSCLFCNGTGEQACLRCNGTGRPAAGGERAPCPDCAGTGKRPCAECRGSKTRPCDTCRDAATGRALGDVLCPACEGAGKRNIPCPDCHGTARAPCSTCRGKGTVPAGCPDCPGSSGQVPVACERCGGAGTCPSCLGRGRRE
jgi:hypothetical protein